MIVFFLIVSLICNVILFWYSRKLVEKLSFGVNNIDQLQSLLDEYSQNLESLYQMEEFYGDEAIKIAISNTRMVVETCKLYKQSILETQEIQMGQEEQIE